jgi:hypothetical protein
LFLLPPFLEHFQQVSFFHFHTWIQNISTLSLYPPPSHWCQPPDRTCFIFLFSIFEKIYFCLR